MAASAPNPAPRSAPPSFGERVQRFWLRVTEGMEINQLWLQFKKDATTSYRLYSRDVAARSPQEPIHHSMWNTGKEFAWSILEKLSPARRVLLLFGFVLLVFPGAGFSYRDRGELHVVEFDFHFVGGSLLFILLMLEIADRVVMKRDLEIARDIQKWLLPANPPPVPGLAIAFATRAANTVAGDFYDVFPRAAAEGAPQRHLFAVADVAGKSIPAALLMATFQASLRTLSITPCELPDLVAGMNRYACSNSQGGLRFTTAFLAEYDPATRQLHYVNAGHNAPIIRRPSGALERLSQGGLPLGIQEGAAYDSARVTLDPGDWLVIFTDGLVEAVNAQGEEYGEERMLANLAAAPNATPDEMLRRLIAAVDAFAGSTPQHDDITCLLVRAEDVAR